jgi:NADH-quinone oxidoreductase subunit N
LLFGLVFLLAGLAFKISAVPFHMWTPDVYEGAPTPVTAFFASAPKVAAVLLGVRVCLDALGPAIDAWRQILIFAALASIILGAVAAYGQTNIKRLLAYSSINNVGFALIGLVAGGAAGASSVLFYMAVYVVMTLGAFLCVLRMRGEDGEPLEAIDSLSGLSQ